MLAMTSWCVIFVLLMALLLVMQAITPGGAVVSTGAALVWACVMWNQDSESPMSDYRGDKFP